MTARTSSSFWSCATRAWLITGAGVVIGLLGACFVMVAWAVIMVWFGIIYIIAFTLALVIVAIVPTKTRDESRAARQFWRFVAVSAIAVVLTLIYSAVNGALFSGTPTGTVVAIQLAHSGIFFVASVIVAVVCTVVRARRAVRLEHSHPETTRA